MYNKCCITSKLYKTEDATVLVRQNLASWHRFETRTRTQWSWSLDKELLCIQCTQTDGNKHTEMVIWNFTTN